MQENHPDASKLHSSFSVFTLIPASGARNLFRHFSKVLYFTIPFRCLASLPPPHLFLLTNAASKCDSLILSLCVSVSLKDNLGNSWMLRKDSGSCRVTLLLTSCLSLPVQWLCCSQMGTVIYAALRCNQALSLKPSTSAPS